MESGKNTRLRRGDSCVQFVNPHIDTMDDDVLYHLALSSKEDDLPSMFGDVKFVCMGGSAPRMHKFAVLLKEALNINIPTGLDIFNMGKGKARYHIFKIGQVLVLSHGMGTPSLSILLHELFKLLHHAKCEGVTIFRVGTCGGLGIEPGSVIVTEEALNPLMKPTHDMVILGKKVSKPAIVDGSLIDELMAMTEDTDPFQIVRGKTLCTDDFYEGQGRLDGAFCNYTEQNKMEYLQMLYEKGVRNIEMECTCFASMCYHAGIKGAVICCSLLDRLDGDQVTATQQMMHDWHTRPQLIVARYIKAQMSK